MSFYDVIKKSVLDGFSHADISTTSIVITLLMAYALGMYVFLVYRMTTKTPFYNRNYGISMAIMTVITAGILLAMQSNFVISLGMVGALSIVRFRTAIKDPLELMYLFWAIGIGIICGARLYELAILMCIVATVGILVFSKLPLRNEEYLLVINCDKNCSNVEKRIVEKLNDYSYVRLRSKALDEQSSNYVYEIRLKKGEEERANLISEIDGVSNVTLMVNQVGID